jgi:hypothetical protein
MVKSCFLEAPQSRRCRADSNVFQIAPSAAENRPPRSRSMCDALQCVACSPGQCPSPQKKSSPFARTAFSSPAWPGICCRLAYFGMSTVSITWITPLSAAMSAVETFAMSTVAPPLVATVSDEPCTVLTFPAFRSAAMTLPGTTW